jgi:hypothetical protein
VSIAHFGAFNAEFFGLAIDAFTTGALRVDHFVERTLAVQGHAHETTRLDIDVFDAAFGGLKLWVIAGLLLLKSGEIERAAIDLSSIAVGVRKLIGRMHA